MSSLAIWPLERPRALCPNCLRGTINIRLVDSLQPLTSMFLREAHEVLPGIKRVSGAQAGQKETDQVFCATKVPRPRLMSQTGRDKAGALKVWFKYKCFNDGLRHFGCVHFCWLKPQRSVLFLEDMWLKWRHLSQKWFGNSTQALNKLL